MSKPEYDYSIHYRIWHDESPEHRRLCADWLGQQLSPYLPLDREVPALDIGCGMGFAMTALLDAGFTDVRGIDTDTAQISACQRAGINAQLVEDSEAFLRSNESVFGMIIMQDVLEHIPVANQLSIIRALHAALIPGGVAFFQVPNASSPLASRWRWIDFTHFTSFTEHTIRFVLLNAGFSKVEVPVPNGPSRPSFKFWRHSVRTGFVSSFRSWLVRWAWKQVLLAELGKSSETDAIPLELNLIAVAWK